MSLRTKTILIGVRREARAVEVISFFRANQRMSTFRSTLRELGFVFLNTNGKAQGCPTISRTPL